MNRFRTHRGIGRAARFALFSLVGLLPVACSSGGGYGEVMISEQNAQVVAMQGVAAVDMLSAMSELGQGFAGSVSASQQVIPCDAGNVNVVVNDAVPMDVLSTGDSASATFNGCVVDLLGGGLPLTMNGGLSFTAAEVTGEAPGPFSSALTVTFSSLTLVVGNATIVVDGSFTIEASSADGDTVVTAISGEFFSVFAQAGNQVFSGTLRDFRVERSLNLTSNVFTMTVDATVQGSGMAGPVTFTTVTPFSGTEPNDPDSGELTVVGGMGSKLTLVAVDTINVQLLIDADGDGTDETTINTTWAALQQ